MKRKVLITGMRENLTLSSGRDLARRYPPEKYVITESFEEASIILYLEYGYIGLLDLPGILHRLRGGKSALHLLFSEADWPFPILPGAYPSLSRPCAWAHSWSFMPRLEVGAQSGTMPITKSRFLFSFLGRGATHPVRKEILLLNTETTPCVDLATAPKRFESFGYSQTYWTLMNESKFVLCPRGFGVSSIRIFEAMSIGRVPVIISDQWIPPPGIPWDRFCVFVREGDVPSIPSRVRQLNGYAPEMGKLAQETFDQYFAPNVFFDQLLVTMESMYSGCEFNVRDHLLRVGQTLGWREIRTVGSQAKSFTVNALRRLVVG